MKDAWESSQTYEYFMGRWSRLVARAFLNWLAPSPGLVWLDVGCGSGALSEAILEQCAPERVFAVDQSAGFVQAIQAKLGQRAQCRLGSALDLPFEDCSVDVTVSGLVLNFITPQVEAIAEMKRVTRSGGIVAAYVWDYAGKMDFLNLFWDAVIELNPQASLHHEAKRFPDSNADVLNSLLQRASFADIETAPIDIDTHFKNFDDYWNPLLGGQGPAPSYVSSLDESDRTRLRDLLQIRLPIQPDGSIPMSARAWAVKARVP